MAKKQVEEDRTKALIEKRTEFIEKTKNILTLPDIIETKPRGRKGKVMRTGGGGGGGGCFTTTKINFKLDLNMAGHTCHCLLCPFIGIGL